jgi:N-acetylglucosaminyldiphosphoundecaprenol N-acetyl-beta-D-mannosaminyltransferase
METRDDAAFRRVVNGADLTVPDGLPLVWAQRLLGHQGASQVRGADLALDLCAYAERERIPLGLFGGSESVIARLKQVLLARFPELKIVYSESPPFRPITAEEDREYVEHIRKSGTKILFVGLGCPKQEQWMAAHKDRLDVVMLGIGAAFDFITGQKKAAPEWMRRIGLEWLFRLASEPRRLWRRYLKHNPRFLWYFVASLAARKLGRRA